MLVTGGSLVSGNPAADAARTLSRAPRQQSFDDLGRLLSDITFVVVDLETTGGSPNQCSITEIGAVKVRGGEVLGEFQTLVRPAEPIPPFISVLTGITDGMVADAPTINSALVAFLEFSAGTVLVAHNAPFDLGFLRAACAQTQRAWPSYESLDTAVLARRILTRDEAPNCKLATLARVFRVPDSPCHRALADAKATVGVLHSLFERVGALGILSIEDLRTFSSRVPAAVRRKRYLAEGLPTGPGVYLFRDGTGRVQYVGTSTNVRSRVRNYFTASEHRTRMAEMVAVCERVDAISCSHSLEASVREVRLIAEHRPRYNRRSRFPERASYLKVTGEVFPRLSLVRKVLDDGATYLGPISQRRVAESVAAALYEAFPIRQCSDRISLRRPSGACALAGLGRCVAPCEGQVDPAAYRVHIDELLTAISQDPGPVVNAVLKRLDTLAAQQRYEEATVHRDRLAAFLRVTSRWQRLVALTRVEELCAASPDGVGGWQLTVIRRGRLVAAGLVPAGAAPRPFLEALRATAETVLPQPGPAPCALPEETELIARWLEAGSARLVESTSPWMSPAQGSGGRRDWIDRACRRDLASPLSDHRGLRPLARPAR
jgi:DNA polymerase-3 subunit epsilon